MGSEICSCEGLRPRSSYSQQIELKNRSLTNKRNKIQYQNRLKQCLNKVLAMENLSHITILQLDLKGILGVGSFGEVFLTHLVEERSISESYGLIQSSSTLDSLRTNQKLKPDSFNKLSTSNCNLEEISMGVERLGKDYALKRIHKSTLKGYKDSLILEKEILAQNRGGFLVDAAYAFQDQTYLYYMMSLATGGDLFSFLSPESPPIICKENSFLQLGEKGFQFLLMGCVLGLEELHTQNIVYRDLKPQNILIYHDGYPRLTDFGISFKTSVNQCQKLRGSRLYMAPEMVERTTYDHGIDLWALGILACELFFQIAPFPSKVIKPTVFTSICQRFEKSPKWPRKDISTEGKSFIEQLLRVEPSSRLGYKDLNQIKKHAFFEGVDWQLYRLRKVESPLLKTVQKQAFSAKSFSDHEIKIGNQKYGKVNISFCRPALIIGVESLNVVENCCSSSENLNDVSEDQRD